MAEIGVDVTARVRKAKDAALPRAFRIRPLTGADFGALLRYDWSPIVVERDTVFLFLTRDHGRYCLVAEDDEGRALGYLVAARSSDAGPAGAPDSNCPEQKLREGAPMRRGGAAFIFHVHVREPERRRGVGRALVGELERTARGDGVDLVWFLAREEAKGFYLKLGYRPSGKVLHPEALRHVTDVKRTMVMAKRLL